MAGWLIWAGVSVSGADHAGAVEFIARPFNAIMAVLSAVVTFHHAQLGMQVVYEDYVPERLASTLLLITRIACLAGVLAVAVVIFTVALGG